MISIYSEINFILSFIWISGQVFISTYIGIGCEQGFVTGKKSCDIRTFIFRLFYATMFLYLKERRVVVIIIAKGDENGEKELLNNMI